MVRSESKRSPITLSHGCHNIRSTNEDLFVNTYQLTVRIWPCCLRLNSTDATYSGLCLLNLSRP